jgi:hypothetical protein
VGRIPIADESPRQVRRLSASGCPFDTGDWSPILELDPYGEVVAIDVERDLDILRVQIRTGWIMEAPNFAARQDQATNGVWIARSAFEPISQVDGAQFVFVGSFQPIVAHGHEGNPIGRARKKGTDGSLCCDQCGSVQPVGLTSRYDALRASTRSLDDRFAVEIDA